MRKSLSLIVFAGAVLFSLSAFGATFAFSPGGLSQASFTSEAQLETITGSTNAITGTVEVDLADPSGGTGSVTFPVTSIRTGIDMRDEHLHSEGWLNAAAHPDITFAVTAVNAPEGATLSNAAPIDVTLTGNLTINGQTQTVEAPATIAYYIIDDEMRASGMNLESNVLRVQSTFEIQLSDYGVEIPAAVALKVANTITLEVRLTGLEQ